MENTDLPHAKSQQRTLSHIDQTNSNFGMSAFQLIDFLFENTVLHISYVNRI